MIVWSAGCEVGAQIRRRSADEKGSLTARQPEDLFGPRHLIQNRGAAAQFVADLVSRCDRVGRIRLRYVDVQRRQLVEKHVAWRGGCDGCPGQRSQGHCERDRSQHHTVQSHRVVLSCRRTSTSCNHPKRKPATPREISGVSLYLSSRPPSRSTTHPAPAALGHAGPMPFTTSVPDALSVAETTKPDRDRAVDVARLFAL